MTHLPALISDLALILCSAAIITLLFKIIRQPVVLGYIVAGILVGPYFQIFPTVFEIESIRIWADIGVIFLMFSLGLEFSFKKLLKVGGVAVLIAIIGVGMTMLTGYLLGYMLGWSSMNALFLGGILAISSTTIIIRAFDELNVKTRNFSTIVLGVLVIEDLVAVVLMVVLSTVSVSRSFEGTEMIISILKLIFFLVLWFVMGIFFLPTLLKSVRNFISEEMLLIVSLALCFLMVVLATEAGYSSALGAFVMGSILAETPKAEKIEALIKPLKNLFGAIFFVSVGMLINPELMIEYAVPILLSTCVLLIGKPFYATIGSLLSGQTLKTSVRTGMSLSQIGEFSFIIAGLGLSLHVTDDFLYPIAVAVSVLTTFTTPFMIRLSEPFYFKLEKMLPQKWVESISSYGLATQRVNYDNDWRKILKGYLSQVIIYSVLILTSILLSTRYLSPLFSGGEWESVIVTAVTLLLIAPFIWALAFSRKHKEVYARLWSKPLYRGPIFALFLSRIVLSLFYIAFLFYQQFTPFVAMIGLIIAGVLLFLFSGQIQKYYSRIEQRFLFNFHESTQKNTSYPHHLAPWDTHFAEFELNPQSSYAGKTLLESRIRENFGVNIALLHRGDKVISVPSRDMRLFPNDIISVIGTDEQLQKFKESLDVSVTPVDEFLHKQNISLHQIVIEENSKFLGKSIRECRIRELTKGLIVGVERGEDRILNPESDLVFEMNDKVWIVGNELRIMAISK